MFSFWIVLLSVLLALPVFVVGWGEPGHRITGRIAEHFYKSNSTAKAVYALLNHTNWYNYTAQWPTGAITWPDPYGYTNSGLWSGNLHFSNGHGIPDFLYERDCYAICSPMMAAIGYCQVNQTLLDCCVVAGIEKYKQELWLQFVAGETNSSAGVNNTNDPTTKLVLLAHFIGDLHQPLHVDVRGNDQGANLYFIQWYGNTSCCSGTFCGPCNLHQVWDTLMIEKRLLEYGPPPPYGQEDPREAQYAADIIALFDHLCVVPMSNYHYDASFWASETVALSSLVYLIPPGGNIDDNYLNASLPIVELQLFKAGRRIAQAMDLIFSGEVSQCDWCNWWQPLCRPTKSKKLLSHTPDESQYCK